MQEFDAIEPDVDAAELEIACSISDTDSTAEDLAGPGRALGKLYTYAGIRLESHLGRAAAVLGKGPLVTAHRIYRNRSIMICMTSHGGSCQCDTRTPKSPRSLVKARKEISRDCVRLVRYVKAMQPSTRKQAIDSILDLSIWDGELRAILEANNARGAISSSAQIARRFHPVNSRASDPLLNSSHKALLYLDETTLNSLLKASTSMLDLSLSIGWGRILTFRTYWHFTNVDSELTSVWQRILVYLRNPELAFVVLRYLRRFTSKILDLSHRGFFESVLVAINDLPAYFEWSECEEMLCGAFAHYKSDTPFFLSLTSDWVLRNAPMIPRFFETPELRLLTECINERDVSDLLPRHTLQAAVFENISHRLGPEFSLQTLEKRYPYHKLRPLLETLGCSTMKTVGIFTGSQSSIQRRGPCYKFQLQGDLHVSNDEENRFFYQIAQHIHSPDSAARAMSWQYLNHYMGHDKYRCRMVLDTLSRIGFNPPEGLPNFIEKALNDCIPRPTGKILGYYRHLDIEGRQHYNDGYEVTCECEQFTCATAMEVPSCWLLTVMVYPGDTFSVNDYHPFIVERNDCGSSSFLAGVSSASVTCQRQHTVYCIIREGTRPEDLRVEAEYPHRPVLEMVESISVTVLRYSPDAYARVVGVNVDSLYTTGPFTWKKSELPKDREHNGCECRMRVLTIEDARMSGYSEEKIFPWEPTEEDGWQSEYDFPDSDAKHPDISDYIDKRFTHKRPPSDPHTSDTDANSDHMYETDEQGLESHDEEAALCDDDTRLYPSDDRSSIRSDVKLNEPSASEDDRATQATTVPDPQTRDSDAADGPDGVDMIAPRSPMESPLDKRSLYLVLLIAALVIVLTFSERTIANIL